MPVQECSNSFSAFNDCSIACPPWRWTHNDISTCCHQASQRDMHRCSAFIPCDFHFSSHACTAGLTALKTPDFTMGNIIRNGLNNFPVVIILRKNVFSVNCVVYTNSNIWEGARVEGVSTCTKNSLYDPQVNINYYWAPELSKMQTQQLNPSTA